MSRPVHIQIPPVNPKPAILGTAHRQLSSLNGVIDHAWFDVEDQCRLGHTQQRVRLFRPRSHDVGSLDVIPAAHTRFLPAAVRELGNGGPGSDWLVHLEAATALLDFFAVGDFPTARSGTFRRPCTTVTSSSPPTEPPVLERGRTEATNWDGAVSRPQLYPPKGRFLFDSTRADSWLVLLSKRRPTPTEVEVTR
jgi:hypothetical protein